jgi:hypothetical protein
MSGLHRGACARKAQLTSLKVADHESPGKTGSRVAAIYFEAPKSFMCCGLLAALSWSSSVPSYLPLLCGANSTETVQVPPSAAMVSQVLALTLNGGVAAGAVVNKIGAGLRLTSVMLWEGLTASGDTGPKLNVFGFTRIFGARPLPFSFTVSNPNEALLFKRSCPFCLPFEVGKNATSIVQEAPGCSFAGQLFAVTIYPLLAVGCPSIRGVVVDGLIRATFAGLLWLPTTWLGNEIDLGLASSVADSELGEAAGVGIVPCAAAIGGVAPTRIATIAAARIALLPILDQICPTVLIYRILPASEKEREELAKTV